MLDRSLLREASQIFRTAFLEELDRQSAELNPIVAGFTDMTTNDARTDKIRFLLELPQMREWVGGRHYSKLAAEGFQFEKVPYEASLTVDGDDIRYDNLGLVRNKILQLAEEAARLPYDQIIQLLVNGDAATSLAYDGLPFFDTGHAGGSNLITTAFSSTSYRALRELMWSQTDANNRSLRVSPTHLYHSIALTSEVRDVVIADRLASGASNVDKGEVVPVAAPELGATEWAMVDQSKRLKPFMWIDHTEGTSFTSKDNPDTSDIAFDTEELRFGVDRRAAKGYAFYQLAAFSDGTV